MESHEFESAIVIVLLSEREFVIGKRSIFRSIAHYIEINLPTSIFLTESALWVVRWFFCNEADSRYITIVIFENYLWAEAVVTRGDSGSSLELLVSSLGIAEEHQRFLILSIFILKHGVAEVNFELLLSRLVIVIKLHLDVVGPSDWVKIEKSEI